MWVDNADENCLAHRLSAMAEEKAAASGIPVIDVSPLLAKDAGSDALEATAAAIGAACETWGFFSITGTESCVSSELRDSLFTLGREVSTRNSASPRRC